MRQSIAHIALLVEDYDDAIRFYVDVLGFSLVEDTTLERAVGTRPGKRWVLVAPPCSQGCRLLLALARDDVQRARIGDQTGGRVFLFLHTDDIARDIERYRGAGVEFTSDDARVEDYGTVIVLKDLYGNLWDLIQPA